jgi:hypothetical protein
MERKIAAIHSKNAAAAANSPLLEVPIRQVMGGAHYMS